MSDGIERKVKLYGDVLMASAASIFHIDQKKMEKQGWRLISCTEIGKGKLNAIYERGTAQSSAPQQQTELNVKNLQLLLDMLNVEEKMKFENDVQQIVNQWLARKATGQ